MPSHSWSLQILVLAAITAAVSAGTLWLRRIALARAWLDVPNDRSSHAHPTPRGGGIMIAVGLCIALAIGVTASWLPVPLTLALLTGGSAVAVVGWIDDRRKLSAAVRFIVHLAAAISAVALLGGLLELRAGAEVLRLGRAGSMLAVLYIVWCINLYNFMDGIDGIAGAEAVIVAIAGGVLSLGSPLPFACFSLAAAVLGFLIWNWPPARIFMGDVGSGLLGYCFAVLSLASERAGGLPLLLWVLLLGAFAFDATVTLVRRVGRGEAWYAAHRTHAYQRLVLSGWSHQAATLGTVGVTLVLSCLAAIAARQPLLFGACLVCATALLCVSYLFVECRRPLA